MEISSTKFPKALKLLVCIPFFDVQMLIAAACGSSAWVLGVVAVHAWQLALFDVQAVIITVLGYIRITIPWIGIFPNLCPRTRP